MTVWTGTEKVREESVILFNFLGQQKKIKYIFDQLNFLFLSGNFLGWKKVNASKAYLLQSDWTMLLTQPIGNTLLLCEHYTVIWLDNVVASANRKYSAPVWTAYLKESPMHVTDPTGCHHCHCDKASKIATTQGHSTSTGPRYAIYCSTTRMSSSNIKYVQDI